MAFVDFFRELREVRGGLGKSVSAPGTLRAIGKDVVDFEKSVVDLENCVRFRVSCDRFLEKCGRFEKRWWVLRKLWSKPWWVSRKLWSMAGKLWPI